MLPDQCHCINGLHLVRKYNLNLMNDSQVMQTNRRTNKPNYNTLGESNGLRVVRRLSSNCKVVMEGSCVSVPRSKMAMSSDLLLGYYGFNKMCL